MKKKRIRMGIVASQFNLEITAPMLSEAIEEAKRKGAEVKAVLEVPGAYEVPFAASILMARKDIDCVAAVGAVIKGETKHDETIMQAVCNELLRLSSHYKKPVGLGISGPGQSEEQARARIKDYAHRAVRAAIRMCEI
ncbi:MAG: 6,7-dimethyl-8-ribityllumazine synthase [Candidatus Micrarchaeota archaeon]|nr:6,7-dimethyl-8-ribityllumazine synthase [Candidatus Micrarchaeota archaeon]